MGGIYKKSLKALEFDKVLEKLSKFAKTDYSKQLCFDLEPYTDFNSVKMMLNYTKEALSVLESAIDIPIDFVVNFDNIDLKVSYLSENELIDISKTIRSSRLVKNFLKENLPIDSLLYNLSLKLYSSKELEDVIFDSFDDNFNIKHNATQTLSGLFSSLKETESSLRETVTKLLNTPDFNKHLQEQIYTIRDDRVVFQVKSSSKNKLNGIVHDVSATNKTFYIEPSQIVPLNNKIRELKSAISAEIIKILSDLTAKIKKEIVEIKSGTEILSTIDFHFTKARYSLSIHAIEPDLTDKKIIQIEKMRHPLLIDVVDPLIENDFTIGDEYHSVIITGSNTGGKTVSLKTVGIFLLMVKSGMFIPCSYAKIYPFKTVLADIGDEQNILQNLSTFSAHMSNVIDILNVSNSDSFVLIDELCAGTDPTEAEALAEVILKRLKQLSVNSVITTHLGALKNLEYTDSYFKNASVEFDINTLSPTYNLIIGVPGLSNAIAVSSNLGLDKTLIEKAKEILSRRKDNTLDVVEKMQNTHLQLSQNLKTAETTAAEAEELKRKYEKDLSELKKSKNKTIKQLKNRFDNELENIKIEMRDIVNDFRKDKSEKLARRSYLRLSNIESKFKDELSSLEEQEIYKEIDWNTIKLNDTVILKKIHQEVVLLSLPDKNDNVFVLMGNLKTKISKSKLAMYNKSFVKIKKKNYQKGESFELKRYSMSSTLDLRGYRVEDGLDELEAYLDKASLANLTPVTIIHGHGTGALKSAVRDFLTTSPYVAKFRSGENTEGGDGVSIVDIK